MKLFFTFDENVSCNDSQDMALELSKTLPTLCIDSKHTCSDINVISLAQLDDDPSSCLSRRAGGLSSCEGCTGLSVVESEIRQMAYNLRALLDKHQDMKLHAHRKHESINDILPPEIISHIFILCVPNDMGNHLKQLDRHSDFFMPIKLGAVSQTWRQIAWSTPRLWMHLVISHRFLKFKSNLCTERQLVDQWIARSKTVPLTIYLEITEVGYYGYQEDDGGPPRNYRPLLDTIAQCSERWQDIYLNIPSQFLVYLLQQPTAIPNVRVLDLRSSTSSYRIPTLFTKSSPGPRYVLLRGLNPNQVNINWGTVTQVHMDLLNVDKCIESMRLAPVLQSCTFSDMTNYDCIPPLSSPLITLPHLTQLNIKAFSTYPPSVYLSTLTLPNLVQLTLSTTYRKGTSYSSFATFLEGSASSLTDLRLIGPALRFGFGTLREIFQATPSVTYLVLGEHSCDSDREDNEEIDDYGRTRFLDKQAITLDPFFQHLADTFYPVDDGAFRLLPNLKSLELSLNFNFKWSDLVLDIFGPLSEYDSIPHQRSMASLRITDRYSKVDHSDSDNQYIPQRIASRMLNLQGQGSEIVYSRHGGQDMISALRNFYGV